MVSTAHQTQDQERNSPSRRAGCLPARSLASVLRRLERPIRSPFIDSFLLCQMPSCFSAGPQIYTGLLVLPEHPCYIYPSPLSWKCSLFPVKGSRTSPQMLCPNPQAEREKASKTIQLAKKGKFIADSSQGSRHASNAVVRGQRALSSSCYPVYKVCISSW